MDNKIIRRVLATGMPRELDSDLRGINDTRRLAFTLDGTEVEGIVKFCGGKASTREESVGELAARWVAQHFPFVELPTLVQRDYAQLGYDYGHVRGAVQHFIDNARTAWGNGRWSNVPELSSFYEKPEFQADALGAVVFDRIICNSDRHGFNWLWRANPGAGERHIVLIDHSLDYAFKARPRIVRGGDYVEAVNDKQFTPEMVDALRRLAGNPCVYLQRLGMESGRIAALRERCQRLAEVGWV